MDIFPRHLPIAPDDLLNPNVVENDRIEFKESWNPEAVLHTICAFANDFHNYGGGYIVIGVAEKEGQPQLPPRGVSEAEIDHIQKELLQLSHLLQPYYFPVLGIETLHNKTVLVLWCPGGSYRPYQAPMHYYSREKNFPYYIRRYSSTVVATGDTQRELLSLPAQVPFDDRFCTQATLHDLNLGLILSFLDAAGSNLSKEAHKLTKEQLLERLQLLDGPQEKKFQGPLPRQIQDALNFIGTKAVVERVEKQEQNPRAKRFWSFPMVALQEALVNQGQFISRRYRNRRVGELLRELELTEGRGTGIPLILEALEANGSPLPVFQTDEEHTFFSSEFLIHTSFGILPDPEDRAQDDSPDLSVFQKSILYFCNDDGRSIKEIEIHMGLSGRSGYLKRVLTHLMEEGLLALTLPEKPTSKYQKRITTPQGLVVLKAQAALFKGVPS